MLNLLGNAIKFTQQGSVLVELGVVRATRSRVAVIVIRCMVSDTGIGIPHEKQPMLFKEFSQADASTTKQFGGTGLGLAISRRLIELMSGMLDFSSEPGVGSRFWFTLPLDHAGRRVRQHGRHRGGRRRCSTTSPMGGKEAAPASTQVERRQRSPQAPMRAARVLVAEDNVVNQRLVKRMLEKLGHTVDIAVDGAQAVTLAVASGYDIILMDCSMPEKDGYQATREIRRLQLEGASPRTPIIALTANAMPEDREKCLAAGMDDYLSKPISQEDLRAMVERYLAPQNALLTTPPSTRSAAPVVADESGLAT